MVRTYKNKRYISDVPEEVIQEAFGAVEDIRLSARGADSRYRMTHTALHYRI